MSQDDDFNQAMQGWLNNISVQQGLSSQPTNQISQTDLQSPFQSLGTIDLAKGIHPDHTGSLGVKLMMDSRSTLGVTQHTFSADNSGSIRLSENQVTRTDNTNGTNRD